MTAKPADPLKDGPYARRFTREQRQALEKIEPLDLTYEIAALRVAADGIFADLASADDPDAKAKLGNALKNAMIGLATLARTHASIAGNPEDAAIQEFLKNVEPYLVDP